MKAAGRKGRAPFRPHSWFGKRRPGGNRGVKENRPAVNETREKKPPHQARGRPWYKLLAVAAVLAVAVAVVPATALADDPDDEDPGWRLEEIYFVPPDPVPGRRIYVERLAVSGDSAAVTLRAAHDLDLKVRVFGGRAGKTLKMGANTSLTAGQSRSYNLTLNGPSPSFTFSWVDALGRSGAVTLKSGQIPYPLPQADGGLCDLELTSLEWTPGSVSGVIASECIAETRQEVSLPVYGGHFSQTVPAVLDASITRITGRVNVSAGSHRASASFVAGGQTRFTLPVANRKATHKLEITADLTATLNVPLPPMLQTTHHPARTDVYTRQGDLPLRRELDDQDRPHLRLPPGARAGRRDPARPGHPHQAGSGASGSNSGFGNRRPLPAVARSTAHTAAAKGGADPGGRFQLVELAVVGRSGNHVLLATGAALASVAAAAPDEKARMLAAFDKVLTGMAYAGVGLCFFAIVWAGFVLMAEGAEGEGPGRGKARNAVIMAVVGLVVVLLAKGIALLISSRLGPILPIP